MVFIGDGIVTTKTEQNNGILMFNTSNEGTGGLGISYSSSSMFEFYGIFLATFNPCILCHMKISYLMIKSVDCSNFSKLSLRDAVVLLHFFKNLINN